MSDRSRDAGRIGFERAVRVRCENWQVFVELWTKNLSRGGIFLRTDRPAPVLTVMQIRLHLPDGRELILNGEVAHVVSPERAVAEGRVPGMGVQFTDLDEERRAHLEALVVASRAHLPAAPTPPPSPGVTRAGRATGDTGQLGTEQIMAALEAFLGDLRERDAFDMLEVSTDATPDEIAVHSEDIAARFAPERFANRPPEVRAVAAEIAIVLAQASASLHDPLQRAEFVQRRLRRTGRTEPRPRDVLSEQLLFGDVDFLKDRDARRTTGAMRILDPLLSAPARSAPDPGKTGTLMLRAARFKEAKDLLRTASEAEPANSEYRRDYHYALAMDLKASNRLDEAIGELQRAVDLDAASEMLGREMNTLHELRKKQRGGFGKLFGDR